MRFLVWRIAILGVFSTLASAQKADQEPPALDTVLRGLAPVTTLALTHQGQAALSANFSVTGGLQMGTLGQSTLLSDEEQRVQALRDATITYNNAADLADGLGTVLGAAYLTRAHNLDNDRYTNATQSVADLLAYTLDVTGAHAATGKYFFANATLGVDKPSTAAEKAIYTDAKGCPDPFGRAYHMAAKQASYLPNCAPDPTDPRAGQTPLNGNKYGDPRPFQTEPELRRITGRDYFDAPSDNVS